MKKIDQAEQGARMNDSVSIPPTSLGSNGDGAVLEVRWTDTHVKIYEHTLDGDVQLGISIQRGDQAQRLATLLRQGPPDEHTSPARPYDTQLEWLERCLREKNSPSLPALEAVLTEATVTGPPVFVQDKKRRERVVEVVKQLMDLLHKSEERRRSKKRCPKARKKAAT